MLSFRELLAAFRSLKIDPSLPVIVHASLSAFGEVRGGARAVVGALLAAFESVLAPAFTYATMVTPETGPPENGLRYGQGKYSNRNAALFDPGMPVDRMIGAIPEALRRHPAARRSLHPILSFTGVNAGPFLEAQTYAEPLAPIGALVEARGWVLLLGVDHTANTSLHYAERLAGRKQFVRWALTRHGARECPGFPGCSLGFQEAAARLEGIARSVQAGAARVQALPLFETTTIVRDWIAEQPLALLCRSADCPRCAAVRKAVAPAASRP